jgi:hypothetical protein
MIMKLISVREVSVTARSHTLCSSFLSATMRRVQHPAALLAGLALLLSAAGATGQGTFQNLNFEAGIIPSGTQSGSMVPISSALPGWSASFITYDGTIQQQTQIMLDGLTLASAFISINDTHGRVWGGPLQGSYSLLLAGGNSLFEGGLKSSTISQTGLVPSGMMSILMVVETEHNFKVSMGGQAINMVPLQTISSYTALFGGDISAFAGQTAQLTITSPYLPPPIAGQNPNPVLLDGIQFSTQQVPEPSVFTLSALGAALLGRRVFRRGRYPSSLQIRR